MIADSLVVPVNQKNLDLVNNKAILEILEGNRDSRVNRGKVNLEVNLEIHQVMLAIQVELKGQVVEQPTM
jgi:hypothetical protein